MAKAVLILGAGASRDYGLPTGAELIDQVEALCRGAARGGTVHHARFSEAVAHMLTTTKGVRVNYDLVPNLLRKFADLIQGQIPTSIDWFLGQEFHDQNYPYFPDVGRLAIAWLVGEAERPRKLDWGAEEPELRQATPSGDSSVDWYRSFWQALGARTFDDVRAMVEAEQLRVVSFNYDRSFDQFILNRLKALYMAQAGSLTYLQPVLELMKRLDIQHVYGELGSTLDCSYGHLRAAISRRDVGASDYLLLAKTAERIAVIEHGRKAEQESRFLLPKQWIESADRLVFLGFGFDEQNVKRLGFPGLAKPFSEVFATTYGISSTQRDVIAGRVASDWKRRGTPNGTKQRVNIQDEHQTLKIADYLYHYQPLKDWARQH